jgi:hypothetical protein
MFTRKFSTATAVGLAALLSASVASAADMMTLNAKEINGRSDYFSVSILNSDLADISWMETREATTAEGRNGKTAKFDDPDGVSGSMGMDYGYVRLETEFGLRETTVSSITGVADASYTGISSNINVGTAMVNMAFEYSVDPSDMSGNGTSGISLTPYVTVGGGALGIHGNLAYTRIDGVTLQDMDEEFFIAPAVQGGVGLTLGLPLGLEVFAQYSEMFASTYNYKSSDDIHIKTASGGLRVNF